MDHKESIESMIAKQVIQSPELADFIDQRATRLLKAMVKDQSLTRGQLAEKYQVSKQSIARLSDENLKKLGFKLIKAGMREPPLSKLPGRYSKE